MAFPETQWSVLALASVHGDETARAALDDLCRRYWQPVYLVIRSLGVEAEDARDRTQSFFLYLLDNATLRRADKRRGRFRTFLMTVLWRFLRDERKREGAEKRGGDWDVLSWDDEGMDIPGTLAEPNEILDREWALATMERALESVRREFVATRGEDAWLVWRGFLPGSSVVPSMALAASVLGVGEGGARTEVHRLRIRCREALRREIMATVCSPDDVDEEIAYLGRALHNASSSASKGPRASVAPLSKTDECTVC